MTAVNDVPRQGGCDCRRIRYRMESAPLFVHCCHCRWCQRETGASFALNAMIETDRVTLLAGEPQFVDTPSASGKGQSIARCPTCRIAPTSSCIRPGLGRPPGAASGPDCRSTPKCRSPRSRFECAR